MKAAFVHQQFPFSSSPLLQEKVEEEAHHFRWPATPTFTTEA